jgi:hypothetical protein
MVSWLKDYSWSRNDEFALKALQAAEEEIKLNSAASVKKVSKHLQQLLDEIDIYKQIWILFHKLTIVRSPKL